MGLHHLLVDQYLPEDKRLGVAGAGGRRRSTMSTEVREEVEGILKVKKEEKREEDRRRSARRSSRGRKYKIDSDSESESEVEVSSDSEVEEVEVDSEVEEVEEIEVEEGDVKPKKEKFIGKTRLTITSKGDGRDDDVNDDIEVTQEVFKTTKSGKLSMILTEKDENKPSVMVMKTKRKPKIVELLEDSEDEDDEPKVSEVRTRSGRISRKVEVVEKLSKTTKRRRDDDISGKAIKVPKFDPSRRTKKKEIEEIDIDDEIEEINIKTSQLGSSIDRIEMETILC